MKSKIGKVQSNITPEVEDELKIYKNKYKALKEKVTLLFETRISSPNTFTSNSQEEDEKENDSEEEKENMDTLNHGISVRKDSSLKNDLQLGLFPDPLEEYDNPESPNYSNDFISLEEKEGKFKMQSSSDCEIPSLEVRGKLKRFHSKGIDNLVLTRDLFSIEESLMKSDLIRHNKGLSPTIFKALDTKILTEIDIITLYFPNCPICLQDFQINEELTYLKCLHYYHSSCIKEWFENKKTCPFCSSET